MPVQSSNSSNLNSTDSQAMLKWKQLQHETDAWKRTLGFMMEENVRLKNRLSEVLRDQFDDKLLSDMENFQNRFVKEDDMIQLMRDDVNQVDRSFTRENLANEKLMQKIIDKMKKLRRGMLESEAKFDKLKSEFHAYLTQKM